MRNHIKSFIVFISFFSILCFPNAVFAQSVSSNCVVTKIGNPGDQKPALPPGCDPGTGIGTTGPCGAVADWAQKISDSLVEGGGGYLSGDGFDNRTQDFKSDCAESSPRSSWAGQYWCTYLVVDAYNLAGISGLTVGGDGLVSAMHAHWRSLPGFFALDYNGGPNAEVLKQVKPGFAIFFGPHGDDDHVGLVKSISFDEHGNGTIETYESNASAKSHKWPIAEWKIMNGGYVINGFGGH